MLVIPSKSLAYPGCHRNPGVNPQHVAFAKSGQSPLRASVVAMSGAAHVSRLDYKGSFGTVLGVASTTDGALGPCVYGTSSAGIITIANGPATSAVVTNGIQVAAIARYPSSGIWASAGSHNTLLASSSLLSWFNGGYLLQIDPITPGIVALNDPVFAWGSQSGVSPFTVNLGIVNLKTGRTMTGTTTAAGAPPTTATVYILNYAVDNFGTTLPLAAAAAIGVYGTLNTFREWAADPWGFWYPPSMLDRLPLAYETPGPVSGTANFTFDALTTTAAGVVKVAAASNVTFDALTVSATGTTEQRRWASSLLIGL